MLALDLLKKPELLEPKPIYVIMGEDVFLRAESISIIEKHVFADDPDKMGLTRKSGDGANLADVMDELATQSFFSPKRMVVLDPADGFITKHRSELEKYAAKPCQGSVFVLVTKLFPSSTNLYKLIEKGKPGGLVIDARPPKVVEMVAWVQGRAALHDAKIDRAAAELLTELVGPEAGLLDQELEKLAVATHDGKKSVIGRDDVARYVHAGQVDTVWAVVEKAATGNAAEALADLDALLSSGENAVGLLAAMAVSLRKLHYAGLLRQRKMPASEAFQEAGFPAWQKAIDAAMAQHKHLGPRRVTDLPNMLAQADLDLKGWSELKPQAVMERLLTRLAQPRKD